MTVSELARNAGGFTRDSVWQGRVLESGLSDSNGLRRHFRVSVFYLYTNV